MQDAEAWRRALRANLELRMQGQQVVGAVGLQILGMLLSQEHGRQYNLREIANQIGCAASNVKQTADRLVRAGLISYQPRRYRTLRATCRWIPASQLGEKPGKVD